MGAVIVAVVAAINNKSPLLKNVQLLQPKAKDKNCHSNRHSNRDSDNRQQTTTETVTTSATYTATTAPIDRGNQAGKMLRFC